MIATAPPRLRPLGLGELLDQAIRLYRHNFFKFIGIVAIVQIPLTLIQIIVSVLTTSSMLAPLSEPPPQNPMEIITPGYLTGVGSSVLLMVVSFIFIQGVATAALTRAIADNRLGVSTDIIQAYSKVGSSWLSLVGALLLLGFIAIGVLIWTLVPCVGWLTGPGILAFLVMVIGPLIAPNVVLERKTAMEAVRRAWDLARRRFFWVIGFIVILYLFSMLIVTGPTALLSSVLTTTLSHSADISHQAILNSIIQSTAQLILSLLYLPLQLSAITLMYLDLRVRTEGFDLALQTDGGTGGRTDLAALLSQAPPAMHDRLVTGNEIGYFVILTVGAVLIYVIFLGVLGILGMLIFSAAGTGGL